METTSDEEYRRHHNVWSFFTLRWGTGELSLAPVINGVSDNALSRISRIYRPVSYAAEQRAFLTYSEGTNGHYADHSSTVGEQCVCCICNIWDFVLYLPPPIGGAPAGEPDLMIPFGIGEPWKYRQNLTQVRVCERIYAQRN